MSLPTHRSKRSEYEAVTSASGHEEDISLAPRHSLGTPTINSQYDAVSMHSSAPLNPNPQDGSTYPPPPLPSSSAHGHVQFTQEMPAPQPVRPGFPQVSSSSTGGHTARNPSWDVLGGYRKFESSYEAFDSRNASEAHLAFADGDVPKNAVSKFYNYLLNVSIVTRWFLFIVPILAILWIPAILQLTTYPNAEVWGVALLWWSIWLSVLWVGWWVALAVSRILPAIVRATVGVVAVASRRYIDWLEVLHRYVALGMWTGAVWISFQPLIARKQDDNASDNAKKNVSLIAKLQFGFFICAGVLLFEKFAIQWIAGKFHERSYAERIADQKQAVKTLVVLYRHSVDIPGRTDTMRDGQTTDRRSSMNPKRFFKKATRAVRFAATTTATGFGNVASEIMGSSVLQPNSPQAMIKTALESANKSRLLARRLFYSFVREGADYLLVEDIARFFPSAEDADAAFSFFDKDSNGDATRDEIELACMECHREQLSIEHSMQDLDSAVGRLDNILMTLYVVVAILIIAIALEAQLINVVTGAGTFLLGISWLIGGSLSEVLTSIIFLFIKHPYDVGDRVEVDEMAYTVKEIRLLSTIFLDSNNTLVAAPNLVLNGKFILNIRRSPQMSEPFVFDVAYDTSFETIEALRGRMIAFLSNERRDYIPAFDVTVKDFPDQEKMTLKVDIRYKSNAQLASVKAKRRNKWICALKASLADVKMYGPAGDPNAKPSTSRYTLVPWDLISNEDRKRDSQARPSGGLEETILPTGSWNLTDRNNLADDTGDVFGESEELRMTNPQRGASSGLRHRQNVPMPAAYTMPHPGQQGPGEAIEMAPSRSH